MNTPPITLYINLADYLAVQNDTKEQNLLKHPLKLENPKKPKEYKFKCDKCNKKFTDEKYLKRHLNSKNSCNDPLVCRKCHTSFSTRNALNKHKLRKICKKNAKPRFVCNDCYEEYMTSEDLARHKLECIKPMIEPPPVPQRSYVNYEPPKTKEKTIDFYNQTYDHIPMEDIKCIFVNFPFRTFVTLMFQLTYINELYPKHKTLRWDGNNLSVLKGTDWVNETLEKAKEIIIQKIKDHLIPRGRPNMRFVQLLKKKSEQEQFYKKIDKLVNLEYIDLHGFLDLYV